MPRSARCKRDPYFVVTWWPDGTVTGRTVTPFRRMAVTVSWWIYTLRSDLTWNSEDFYPLEDVDATD